MEPNHGYPGIGTGCVTLLNMTDRAGHRPFIVAIVILQVLQVLSLAAWLFASVFAVAALGEDRANAGTYLAVGTLLSYPLWLAGLGVATWALVRRAEPGWALGVAIFASLPVILLLVLTLLTM